MRDRESLTFNDVPGNLSQAAFAMKVRSGSLDKTAAGMQRARFLLDVAAGDLEVYSVTEDHFALRNA